MTNKRALVAVTSKHMSRALGVVVRALGYDVDEASDGLQAIAMLRGGASYDVLVLDVDPRCCSNSDVVREKRALPRAVDVPVLWMGIEAPPQNPGCALIALDDVRTDENIDRALRQLAGARAPRVVA